MQSVILGKGQLMSFISTYSRTSRAILSLGLFYTASYLLSACGSGSSIPQLGGGGGGVVITPPTTSAITVTFTGAVHDIDENQSELITASVNGAPQTGVTWSLTCPATLPACGQLLQTSTASGAANRYIAPNSVSTAIIVTVTATSKVDQTQSASGQITVNPRPTLVVPAPPQPAPVIVGQSFSFDLKPFVQGGTAPFTWSVGGGSLPAGLTLDANSGIVSGVVAATTTQNLVGFYAKDSSGAPGVLYVSITFTIVSPLPLLISPASGALPSGAVGVLYGPAVCVSGRCAPGVIVAATGGAPPYTWSWAAAPSSSVPPGLSLATVRISYRAFKMIFGRPSTAGTYNVVVTVTDARGPAYQVSADYTIVIDP
jgi:hypothetical protein